MTMIDPTTGWFKLASLQNGPTSLEAQRLLGSVWLARYPRPREIGFDEGSKFKAKFWELCINLELNPEQSNSWNLQSNAILERVHQFLGDNLRSFDLDNAETLTQMIRLKNF